MSLSGKGGQREPCSAPPACEWGSLSDPTKRMPNTQGHWDFQSLRRASAAGLRRALQSMTDVLVGQGKQSWPIHTMNPPTRGNRRCVASAAAARNVACRCWLHCTNSSRLVDEPPCARYSSHWIHQEEMWFHHGFSALAGIACAWPNSSSRSAGEAPGIPVSERKSASSLSRYRLQDSRSPEWFQGPWTSWCSPCPKSFSSAMNRGPEAEVGRKLSKSRRKARLAVAKSSKNKPPR